MQPQLLNMSPDDLAPNPWNTNIVTPDNEAKLAESLRRNGMFKPVIVRQVDDGFEILGGEHRWALAKKMGLEQIPVVNVGEIDDRQAKEISVLDNARYGADDTLQFSELLKQLGDIGELQDFLPYNDEDISLIFSSENIALDELDIDENFTADEKPAEEERAERPAKTHTVMRFKVSLRDAERLTALLARTQREQGLTTADDLTNAGDALIHLLLDEIRSADTTTAADFSLADIDESLESLES